MHTVIISGASGNLGKSIVRRFLEGSWRVYALCRQEEDTKSLVNDFATFAHLLNAVACNLSDTTSLGHFFSTSGLRSCDAVIHTAGGIQAGTSLEETPPETVLAMLEINYITAFHLLRLAVPLLKVRGGAVLTIGAKSALEPEKNKAAYSASKAALIALTQATAHEGKPHNIRANCIVPSIIDTPQNREWGKPEDVAKWITPETIADAAWMLCTDGGQGISGALLPMYGKM